MRKTLIVYSLSGEKKALDKTRKIYGYKDSSNHGRYVYERTGVLSDIPYEKIARSVFWIEPKYKSRVVSGLKALGLQVKTYEIDVRN